SLTRAPKSGAQTWRWSEKETALSKSVAWAYSIAGLAVAVAIIVVAGSTAGLIGSAAEEDPGQAVAVGVPPAADGALLASADTQGAASDAGVEDVEYVYVDAPVSDRDYDDDD